MSTPPHTPSTRCPDCGHEGVNVGLPAPQLYCDNCYRPFPQPRLDECLAAFIQELPLAGKVYFAGYVRSRPGAAIEDLAAEGARIALFELLGSEAFDHDLADGPSLPGAAAVIEAALGEWAAERPWEAKELRERTGIDPRTTNLAELCEYHRAHPNEGYFCALCDECDERE